MIDWRIPRPLLYTSSSKGDSSTNTYSSNYEKNIQTIYGLENNKEKKTENVQIEVPNQEKWFSSGSSSSSSSRVSTFKKEFHTIIITKEKTNEEIL